MNYRKNYQYDAVNRRTFRAPLVVVLDLDETLIHTLDETRREKNLYNHESFESPYGEMVKRPGVDKFINQLFETDHTVFVWTAADREYAKVVCQEIFHNHKPVHIYARDNCVDDPKDRWKKPVQQIGEDYPFFNIDRMVMVDDRRKAYYPEDRPHLIEIKAWEANTPSDSCLEKTLELLNQLSQTEHIPDVLNGIDWRSYWKSEGRRASRTSKRS